MSPVTPTDPGILPSATRRLVDAQFGRQVVAVGSVEVDRAHDGEDDDYDTEHDDNSLTRCWFRRRQVSGLATRRRIA